MEEDTSLRLRRALKLYKLIKLEIAMTTTRLSFFFMVFFFKSQKNKDSAIFDFLWHTLHSYVLVLSLVEKNCNAMDFLFG